MGIKTGMLLVKAILYNMNTNYCDSRTPEERKADSEVTITTTTNSFGVRVYCLICGDVTDGHPEHDRLMFEMLNNGFKTEYTQ